MQTITLSNGVEIPQVGLGVFRAAAGDETVNAVRWALEAGYRHIDTAMVYGNEAEVGRAIRESGVPREQVFVTTKLWNDDIRAHRATAAYEESLERLGLDYVDLYLTHWPAEGYLDAFEQIAGLCEAGRIRAVGVSNCNVHHLEDVVARTGVVPAVDQVESNPYFANQELVDYCQAHGIAVEAWSPLGGSLQKTNVLTDETIAEVAVRHGVSIAQVIIRWHIQRGLIVLPKSTHRERIRENLDVFGFELADDEMEAISALDRGTRVGSDPDNFDF